LTLAVAIAWHETSRIAGSRSTGNNYWCQKGVEKKQSRAAIPSEFISFKDQMKYKPNQGTQRNGVHKNRGVCTT